MPSAETAVDVAYALVDDWQVPGELSGTELRRAAAMRSQVARRHFIAGRGLLRAVLAQKYAGALLAVTAACERCGDEHGRPRVRVGERTLGVSVTHSGDVVAVAVGHCDVGIDIERRGRVAARFADRVLSGAERQLNPEPDDALVTQLWVHKEALLKALGAGLAGSMTEITVERAAAEYRGEVWNFAEIDVDPEYVCVLALPPDAHLGSVAEFRPGRAKD